MPAGGWGKPAAVLLRIESMRGRGVGGGRAKLSQTQRYCPEEQGHCPELFSPALALADPGGHGTYLRPPRDSAVAGGHGLRPPRRPPRRRTQVLAGQAGSQHPKPRSWKPGRSTLNTLGLLGEWMCSHGRASWAWCSPDPLGQTYSWPWRASGAAAFITPAPQLSSSRSRGFSRRLLSPERVLSTRRWKSR